MLINNQIQAKPPAIGSGFLGRHTMFYDGRTGEYWESMPPVENGMLKIQKALLRKIDKIAFRVKIDLCGNA